MLIRDFQIPKLKTKPQPLDHPPMHFSASQLQHGINETNKQIVTEELRT
jgi:hypothetical protein